MDGSGMDGSPGGIYVQGIEVGLINQLYHDIV